MAFLNFIYYFMSNPFIQVQNLSKNYLQKKKVVKRALSSASFDLKRGEVLGLLGVNGAGKTTLVSILATLHPPTSGDVLWEGKSIYKDLLRYRRIIGFCPQRPNIEAKLFLDELLVSAGRCYGLSKTDAIKRKNQLLDEYQLTPYARYFSPQLSGGYRQRFLIARALMHQPELLILDEPTVGLDPHIRRQLWEMIAELRAKKISIILTTHYLDEAETLSDRVCLIHEGSIRTIDTPQNLMNQHQKNNLEEVFLKFVDDPEAEIFNSASQ